MITAPENIVDPPHQLELAFRGRVIDHLGIQMYQSPIAVLAELVANAWDADAEHVAIEFPAALDAYAEIVVGDDGRGMTFDQCQQWYLEVGRNRRGEQAVELTPGKARPALGRKGIGKFAGFGIAHVIEISTISEENGEYTKFFLDLDELRKGKYAEKTPAQIEVLEYAAPAEARRAQHGTTVRLKRLSLKQRPAPTVQAKGLARRFLLHQRVDDFAITADGDPLPAGVGSEPIEFTFPADYTEDEKPEGLVIAEDRFGEERVDGNDVRWQIVFYKDTIKEEELQGVAVFADGKLAQTPFYFELTGGTTAQAGLPYLSGVVEADFLDKQAEDLIATERQRVDWNNETAEPLLNWGEKRIRDLLNLWNTRRVAEKMRVLNEKLAPFSDRLDRLQPRERKTVRAAIEKLGGVRSLSTDDFVSLSEGVMLAWETGRLRDLITSVSETDELSEEDLIALLVEANTLTALAAAEGARTKLLVVVGLKERIERREPEIPLRDYIAKHPWLLGPQWDTYKVEVRVTNVLKEARESAGLDDPEAFPKRIDLVLNSGGRLLVAEFMKPGVKLDYDHLNRFERYVRKIRAELRAATALGFDADQPDGLIVADRLSKDPDVIDKIQSLKSEGMLAIDWPGLLAQAAIHWRDYFEVLVGRGEDDERLRSLADSLELATPQLTVAEPEAPSAAG